LEPQEEPSVNHLDLLALVIIVVVSLPVYLIAYYLHQRCAKLETSNQIILEELKGLRHDLEARFGVRFSDKGFSEADVFPFFFAVANALHRFERDNREGEMGRDSITEARGYVAILNLILSWAEANRIEGVKRKAMELLTRSEEILQKTKRL